MTSDEIVKSRVEEIKRVISEEDRKYLDAYINMQVSKTITTREVLTKTGQVFGVALAIALLSFGVFCAIYYSTADEDFDQCTKELEDTVISKDAELENLKTIHEKEMQTLKADFSEDLLDRFIQCKPLQ